MFIHEGYDPKNVDGTDFNDIALIKLRTPIKYGRFVKPICLPKNKLRMDITTSSNCYITGWGYNVTYNGVSEYLKQVSNSCLISQLFCPPRIYLGKAKNWFSSEGQAFAAFIFFLKKLWHYDVPVKSSVFSRPGSENPVVKIFLCLLKNRQCYLL